MSKVTITPGGPAWFRSGVQSFQPAEIVVDLDKIRLRDSSTEVDAVLVEVKTAKGSSHWLTLSKAEALDLATAISAMAVNLP